MYTPNFMYNPNDEDYATLPHKGFSPNIEKWEFVERMDKLQTEISGIKQAVGCIGADLKKLTVSVHTLQIAVDRLLKDKH